MDSSFILHVFIFLFHLPQTSSMPAVILISDSFSAAPTPVERSLATEQLFVSRLAYSNYSDDFLPYIGSRVNSTLLPLSCVKLTTRRSPDRVIASFEVINLHDFGTIAESSFWAQRVFIKSYYRTKLRENFRTTRLPWRT